MRAGLLDTSVFIAGESGREIDPLPERGAVSVVTLGELQLGVLTATNADTRARRADTLALARRADPIPITEAVIVAWARLVYDCAEAGISRALNMRDALIAATAVDRGVPVVTQDDDFDRIARAHPPLQVLRV